jgi:hypothetical protein
MIGERISHPGRGSGIPEIPKANTSNHNVMPTEEKWVSWIFFLVNPVPDSKAPRYTPDQPLRKIGVQI